MTRIPLFLLTLALIWINGRDFSKRHDWIQGRIADYSTLYQVLDAPAISKVRRGPNSVELDWIGQVPPDALQQVPLEAGHKHYDIGRLSASLPLNLSIRYVPPSVYQEASNAIGGMLMLKHANLPLVKKVHYSISDWCNAIFYKDSPATIAWAQEVLRREAGIVPTDSDREKLFKLVTFLSKHVDGRQGIPSQSLLDSSSLTQFRALYEDGAPVWCTNIARIYCALANLTGLPTREVNAAGLYDGIQFTGHAFAESYLREQQTWVFVDVASGKAMVTTMDDRPLNSVQLWQQTQLAEDQPALLAWVYRDGTITQTPYAEARWSEQEYFGPNTDLLFPPPKSYPLSFMEKGYHYLLQTNRVWSADPTSLFARQTLQQLMRLGLLLSSSTILILSLLRFNRRNLESK